MRQQREFDRAYLQLVNKRDRERRYSAVSECADEKGGNEPGHPIDSNQIHPFDKPGLKRGTTPLQPATPILKPENARQREPLPDAA